MDSLASRRAGTGARVAGRTDETADFDHRLGSVIAWWSNFQKTSGQITAKRYVAGEPEEDLDAGLILNTLGEKGEDLLLGRKRPEDYPPDEPKRGFFRRGGARR